MNLQAPLVRFALILTASVMAALEGQSQVSIPSDGRPALSTEALLTTPVGGLERTNAMANVVPVSGAGFGRALRVTIRANATETNATQLTMPITAPVSSGDVMLASFYVRGSAMSGRPGQVELLFERVVDPWTKSVTHDVTTSTTPSAWKRVFVPFKAAETYKPGEAMVSIRFAFGPQTVEVGGLRVEDYGRSRSLEELIEMAVTANPLGSQHLTVSLAATKQPIIGFGGNFTAPRYGATAPFDAIARYNLDHLRIIHARIGIPLNVWAPEKGIYNDAGPAHAALLQLQELAKRKIPVVASIWEGPAWLLPGTPEQASRRLAPAQYGDCIEAIGRFLVTARDTYGAAVDNFSFNEADYGVNFRFRSEEIAAFIRQAGPRFKALGLKTKFLVGDTGGGAEFAAYARPLLEDPSIAEYLGPLAFHCWDVLSTPDAQYEAIAALGHQYNKPIWCTEAGHDSGLWQKANPWLTWDNALNTALAYTKTLRLSGARLMDYWTYENDYPLVNKDTLQPYPVWYVLTQMAEALPPGAYIATTTSTSDDLKSLATVGSHAGQFSVLLVNPIGEGRIEVSGLPADRAVRIKVSAGSASQAQAHSFRTDSTGNLLIDVPARSVITIVSDGS